MVEQIENKEEKVKPDPIDTAINTPDDKMSQFTVIPTGGVNAFAMCGTIDEMGTKPIKDMTPPMTRYMDRYYKLNRSRGGMMLAGLLKLAQTKAEVTADESVEQKRFKI